MEHSCCSCKDDNGNNNNKTKYILKIAAEATAVVAACYAFDYVW